MNRQIKFRVWNSYRKSFVERSDYPGNNVDSAIRFDGKIIAINGSEFWFPHQDNFVVQQFTGLLDKNGREIYGGDILKYGNLPYEVMWSEYQWIATCPNYNHCHWPKFEYFAREAKCSEIIGNIFEHPDLLK